MSDADVKDVKNYFDKFLYIPWPDYTTRLRLWSELIRKRVRRAGVMALSEDFDFCTLARVSEGYSAGSISYTVNKTLTNRRLSVLRKRQLREMEFVNTLSRCPCTFNEDNEQFRKFTANVTGLKKRRDMVRGGGGGGKKKKGKKKGKKKKK
jgi:SpoVK/Ycf46/Vps4 family AAA+-type ATPase